MTTPLDHPHASTLARIEALCTARMLAHKLARITSAPAHVVNDDGHPLLASEDDIGVYWTREQIMYTAEPMPAAFGVIDTEFAPVGWIE